MKAREHLGYVFDAAEYDVACVLVPLAWLARLFAKDEKEGESNQNCLHPPSSDS